jgi:2-C-methyl-D-erythritol 4-phosphate cytidylyltransferase
MPKRKVFAIIVAAGKGIRMNDPLKKQYQSVAGSPIVVHTLNVFDSCALIDGILLVVPDGDLQYCRKELLADTELKKKITLVSGGPRRQDSVYNALQKIDAHDSIVVIHDGVRPFLTLKQLETCIQETKAHGACILGVPAFDTLKRVTAAKTIVETIDREDIWFAQTPQAFRYDLIRKAHDRAKQQGFFGTDDAALVEQIGIDIRIIAGSRSNIKITSTEDLELARLLLEHPS